MAAISLKPVDEQSPAKKGAHHTTEFTSDVGRKRFGFSHEELDDSSAYYEGQFKLSLRCGSGTLCAPDTGSKYVGQFQDDQFHGWGEMIWSDGSRYGGSSSKLGDAVGSQGPAGGQEYANSDRQGRQNEGQWRHGQKHGFGEYTSADGLRYIGQWEDSKRHGQGTQEYANNDKYEGWWYRGLCSGLGTYHFADGSRYEGAWANGRYDGPGVLYGSDGTRERHWYSTGLLMKREVMAPAMGPPTRNSRREGIRGKALHTQIREELSKPVRLPKPQPSKYLIQRETEGFDLSAPPVLKMAVGNGVLKPVPALAEPTPAMAMDFSEAEMDRS
jgi:hypothetical protein